MEWLLGAVLGYAFMLLLLGLYIVVHGLPAGWLGAGQQKGAATREPANNVMLEARP